MLKWLVAIISIVAVGLLIALIVVLVNDNETTPDRLLAPTIRLNNGMEFPTLGLGENNLIRFDVKIRNAFDFFFIFFRYRGSKCSSSLY